MSAALQALRDKAVLVTGASRGIGAGIARLLAARGARVAVHYHAAATEAAEIMAGLAGAGHVTLQADLADPDQAAGLAPAAATALGRLDGVVNNAGIYELHDITELAGEDWRRAWVRTLSTNLDGPVHVMHGAIPHLQAAGGGHIVNITSRGAYRGEPEAPAYGAAKAALNSISQSLALKLAPLGIHVVAVAPGWVLTDMTVGYLEGPEGADIRGQSPLDRTATVDEVAEVVALVLSGRADALTGAVIDVNCASYLR